MSFPAQTATIHQLPTANEKQLTIEGFMELPEPLTPAELDIRDFSDLPIDAGRVLSSRFVSTVDPAAGFFSMQLWFASWGRVPAASLPNDDRQLCHLCGLGRDLKTWESIKQDALYGWKLCSDGNYYHPVIAEKALVAWIEKLHQRIKSGRGNASRWGCAFSEERELIEKFHVAWGILKSNNPSGIPSGIPQDIPGQSQGKVREGKVSKEEDNTPYSPPELELEAEEEKTASPDGFACVGESFESVVQESFESLWDDMPLRKVSKETAIKAWKKICTDKRTGERKKKTPDDEIMQAIRSGADAILKIMLVQAEHVAGYESPFHRLHLGTYLNGKRWRDEEMPERLRPMKAGGAA